MIAAKVIDASALTALAFHEPAADIILAQIEGFALEAPDLLPYETANVARTKVLRTPEHRDHLFARLEHALTMGITLHQVDQLAVARIAVEEDLTAYDASYAWLAWTMRLPLVTLDKKLQAL